MVINITIKKLKKKDSPFSISSPTSVIIFGLYPPYWCEIVSHCVLICISLMTKDAEDNFMFIGHLYIFFEEMFILFFCPFFDWVVSVLIVEL